LQSVRNFVIDITNTDPGAYVCAIHWQVAQGGDLQNIDFIMKHGTTQQVCNCYSDMAVLTSPYYRVSTWKMEAVGFLLICILLVAILGESLQLSLIHGLRS
jgi:hypothetical protein